ncbi:glucan 1,4-alpha-glucosidase [Cyberlindnera jadinii NRRL Y-1542]|uniref:glucan 1,4-alpha-glucosidase n=1 Tax=Cyberlindnera jadinii (strain ATCC 18201 / CBS 1600 / BCRC 20928 / JCM 3617 / NBRC 0987 / NRRL Y-1542) TaxID=983966 RepID=A0A1E4S749_CYBJN|nr:Six-hairpin glycosidase [Cyberlindnera jadinii NRRL Y-1542]ODV75310.1 Six-hairpin glycosidase [Cyberlindnera jadinii NRRL Y-1542]
MLPATALLLLVLFVGSQWVITPVFKRLLPSIGITTVDSSITSQNSTLLYHIHPYREISRHSFEKWVEEQVEISFDKILKNIGDHNWSEDLILDNVSEGAIIASPSRHQPDYFYQWIRDGAITINSVTNFLSDVDSFKNKSLQLTIENYLRNSHRLQRTDNPSGKYDGQLKNLGEPKFEVDSTPFWGNWGRPQNDGPSLRVIAVSNFIRSLERFNGALIQTHEFSDVEDLYHSIVKLDLQYICLYWKDKNFDLWEEVDSYHFFTSITQLKALKIGIELYEKFEDEDIEFGYSLRSTSDMLNDFIFNESGFVNDGVNHILETPSIVYKRSGLDAATLLGSLLTHDDDDDGCDNGYNVDQDPVPFDVTDRLVLNTLSEMVKAMKFLYPINKDRLDLNLGVALGRYPEDVYDGLGVSEGNPWFLCTLAASELMFKLIHRLSNARQDLIIDRGNHRFYFNHIVEIDEVFPYMTGAQKNYLDLQVIIPYNSLAFNQTIWNIFKYGDSFLDVVREHVSDEGSMSEQFNRYTGYMQGAEDLTWSYGSFWSTYRWRKRALAIIGDRLTKKVV